VGLLILLLVSTPPLQTCCPDFSHPWIARAAFCRFHRLYSQRFAVSVLCTAIQGLCV
jgi:hypothetical protein